MTSGSGAGQGRSLFGAGALLFGHGLTWFHSSWPGGIFTLHPLNAFDAFHRAEIVIGAMMATYGILLWRSASRKLSLANYTFVILCACVLVLAASRIAEWDSFLDRQRRGSLLPGLSDFEVAAIKITVMLCIAVFGVWWADSEYIRERFHSIRVQIATAGLRSISDELSFSQDGADQILEICACREKQGWNPPRTVRYADTYYRLETASLGDRPRPFQYTLRRLPAGVPGLTLLWYTPTDVVIRKERQQ